MDHNILDQIEDCANEPIHIPGSIQPWGALVALEKNAPYELLYWSENLEKIIGSDVQNDILQSGLKKDLEQFIIGNVQSGHFILQDALELNFKTFDPNEDIRVFEISQNDDLTQKDIRIDVPEMINLVMSKDNKKELFQELCKTFVNQMQAERVLVYQFDTVFNGHVIAEHRISENVQSFINQHFPETDIPMQARQMLFDKKVRVIPDVSYKSAQIKQSKPDLPALNLTLSELRGVSPLHIEYCKNMELGATLTLSICEEDKLWGLLSVHFDHPISFNLKYLNGLRELSDIISLKVQALKSQRLSQLYRDHLNDLSAFTKSATLSAQNSISDKSFSNLLAESCEILNCDAIFGQVDESYFYYGIEETTAKTLLKDLPFEDGNVWTVETELSNLLSRDQMELPYCGAMSLAHSWAGSKIIALRKETEYQKIWAGNPEKEISNDKGISYYAPRRSFQVWEEFISGRCAPWTRWDILAFPYIENEIRRYKRVIENERLALLARHMTNGVIFTSEKGLTTWVNKSFTRTTGFSLEDMTGKKPGQILQGPLTDPETVETIRKALTKQQGFHVEILNYTKQGNPIWLQIDCSPIFDGKILKGFIAVESELTNQKIAEEKLDEAIKRMEVATKAAKIGIWEYNIQDNRLVWDEQMYQIYGYEKDNFSGAYDAWVKGLHPDDKEVAMAQVQQSIDTLSVFETNFRIIRQSDKAVRHIASFAQVYPDLSGKATKMVGINMDISDKAALEEKLHFSQRMESIGKLTGGIAHDFNNIMQIVSGNTELLQDLISEANLPELKITDNFFNRINSSISKASRLTNRLLTFSRKQSLTPIAVDLNMLINELMEMLKDTIGENIKLHAQLEEKPIIALVDPQEFENAIINAVVNARDAMPEGGQIEIRSNRTNIDTELATSLDVNKGKYIKISIIDEGMGIDEAHLSKVFDPFFTTKEFGQGSGLGLSMIYGFVKQSAGGIDIKSTLGKGTIISLYVPLIEDNPHVSIRPGPDGRQRYQTSRKLGKILMIEDNPEIMEVNVIALQNAGFDVVTAQDAKSGIDALNANDDLDLVFTDVVLPGGMNGIELSKHCEEIRPGLKVLFATGYFEKSGSGIYKSLTSKNTLLKPFSHTEMIDFLSKHLTKYPK